MVFEEESQTITTSGEIGDEDILYDEGVAVTKVQDWIEDGVNEFDSNQLETPIVKEIVK